MRRFEAVVGGICLGAWLVAAALLFAPLDGGRFALPERGLFPLAAAVGWLAGNFYVGRSRSAGLGRRGLLALYLGGPPGLVWLYWAMAPSAARALSPFAPLLALAVFGVFFLVPVSLRGFPHRT